MNRMLSLASLLAVISAARAVTAAGSTTAGGPLCVDLKRPGCSATIQAAVNAAQDGDTIEIGQGTFAGGITITKSVQLVGASAAATVISGGGPVITIGQFEGDNDLTVALSRLTIRGGFNDSQPDTSVVAGGGVWIPQSSGNRTGATVSIDDSVISGNRVTARTTIPAGEFPCSAAHAHPCAFVGGGGINNSGVLTLTNTHVTDNVSGAAPAGSSLASYAAGGGIVNNSQGTLTLVHSSVTGNRAAVVAPNGAFTDGGGISDGGVLKIEDSVVGGNTSSVSASVPSVFPSDVQVEANAGGIYLTQTSIATVTDSTIGGNGVISTNTAGDVEAESGGIDSDGSLTLIGSSVDQNTVTGSVPADSGFLVEADGAGLQIQGVTTLRTSRVTGNSLSATSATGAVLGSGAGVFNIGATLTLERTLVTGNSAAAYGAAGVSVGGGIANVQFFGPAPELALADSVVAANRLTTSSGVASEGGGIFNLAVTSIFPFVTGDPFPLTLSRTVISGNRPDQCAGC